MKIRLIWLGVWLFAVASCKTPKKIGAKNLRPYASLNLNIKHRLIQQKEYATFYFQTYAQHYRLTLRIFPSHKDKTVILEKTQEMEAAPNVIQAIKLPIQAALQTYVVELLFTNLDDQTTYNDVIFVKTTTTNEHTVRLKNSQQVVLNRYVPMNTRLQLFSGLDTTQTFYVRYFSRKYHPAPPPHIRRNLVFNPKKRSKTTFVIPNKQSFTLAQRGVYFIQTDTLSDAGLFVNCFAEDFPKLTQAEELTWSVRYISKNEEYKKMTARKANKKLELDKFWLQRGGTKEKARWLISQYYNRIQQANEYFTSYKAGWKTDRGIIFTIFGQPTRVQKTRHYEYWFYKRNEHRDYVEFFFDKQGLQYTLRRSPHLEMAWNAQIYEWRSGTVEF